MHKELKVNPAIQSMLARYKVSGLHEEERALKEIIQEVALLGLWRAKFFEHAAFYGGTALRIFHGLNRFSEDLDFSLLAKQDDFTIASYLNALKIELQSYGFEVTVEKKIKSQNTAIESAFIKGNTQIHLLKVGSQSKTQRDRQLKIKLELDTNPPLGATTEAVQLFLPIPFSVKIYDLPSLFAGKLHAALCRKRVHNVKGRDWYDFLWYVGRGVSPNIPHLEMQMRQTENFTSPESLTLPILKSLLINKLDEIDLEALKADVAPFITNPSDLDGWNRDLFKTAITRIPER
jgi:predicted nucleotidyltransferase component of viral defense system